MEEKKKILVVSLGSIGRRHLMNARTLLPGAEVAVYRQHTQVGDEVPEFADQLFGELADAEAFKPDVVLISSPASQHVVNAVGFLNADAHLFIEKPLAPGRAEIDELLKVAAASRRFVMVGYVLRFLPALRAIKEMLKDNALGAIHTAHIQVGQYLPDWRPDSNYRQGVSAQQQLGGGALLELSHELDYASWLFGLPESVYCHARQCSALEIDVEDTATVIYRYGSDRPLSHVTIEVDFLQRVAQMTLQIVGEKGTLKADLIKEQVILLTPEHPDGEKLNLPSSASGNEPYLRQFDFLFSQAFKDYKPQFDDSRDYTQWVDLQHAADIIQVVEAAKRSNAEGRAVPVELV